MFSFILLSLLNNNEPPPVAGIEATEANVPTSEVPKDKGVEIFGSTTGEGTVVPKPTASEKKEKEVS